MYQVVINNSYGGFNLTKEDLEYMSKMGSKKAKETLEKNLIYHKYYYNSKYRTDPYLIQLVKNKKASSPDLVVKKIKSNKFFITEYDGLETLHTPENIKWINIKS